MSLIELQTASAGNLNIEQAGWPQCTRPTGCPELATDYSSITYLFGLSQSTQNVMQYVYVDIKER